MSNFSISYHIDRSALSLALSHYSSVLPKLTTGELAILVFFNSSVNVATTGMVRRAMRKIKKRAGRRVFVSASDFTTDALELCRQNGLEAIHNRHFGWTDESWYAIRQRGK